MRLFRPTVIFAALMLVAGAPSLAGEAGTVEGFSADEQARIVEIVEKGLAEQRQPGLNVGIWIPGRGTFLRAFGNANIETGAAMDLADHVRVASITKTFVAVAVLRLVDQGKLDLDDTLASYIEGVPNGERITIRNLLGMTSGVYNFTNDDAFVNAWTDNPLMAFRREDVLAILERHEPDFAPGAKVVYCDTNYILLGIILEKVAGKPVQELIATEIITTLGLTETSFPTTPAIPEPFAHGYYAGEDGKGELRNYTATNPEVAWTAGAMISTLDDLRIWAKAIATGALLTPKTHGEQMRFGSLASGQIDIGYGLGVADFGGLIGHNGAIFGYTTAMFYVPAADATIVIAGNQSSNSSGAATAIAYALAKHLLPDLIQ